MILEIDTEKPEEKIEIDTDRIKDCLIRFRNWAKDNKYDGSFEEFIEANLEAIGY